MAANLVNTIKMCQEFGMLPKAGGLYDQDSLFVYLLKNYLIWSEQRAELDRRKTDVKTSMGRSP
jgi:hypothetical protein